MAKVRIGINGFGRIGRGFVRCLAESQYKFDLVLINDLTDVKTLGHLLKHDSVHGPFPGTVKAEGDARFDKIAEQLKQWQPDALVIGVPFHPDGAEHENTRRARRFARQLHGRFGLAVHEVDERWSTTEALAAGARDADAAAAALLLEQWFRERP